MISGLEIATEIVYFDERFLCANGWDDHWLFLVLWLFSLKLCENDEIN